MAIFFPHNSKAFNLKQRLLEETDIPVIIEGA